MSTMAAVTLCVAVPAQAHTNADTKSAAVQVLRAKVNLHRSKTWKWQDRAGIPRTTTAYSERETTSLPYIRWVNRLWNHRQFLAWTKARTLAVRAATGGDWAEFSCIHSHEGATNANTGNGYYGGLQMDYGFQATYGPEFLRRWGTADHWPVWAQVEAARRARDSGRGYGPWPNTARMCGQL